METVAERKAITAELLENLEMNEMFPFVVTVPKETGRDLTVEVVSPRIFHSYTSVEGVRVSPYHFGEIKGHFSANVLEALLAEYNKNV